MYPWATLRKTPAEIGRAHLRDYPRVRHDFSWAHARSWLAGLPGGAGLNIGYEAVDRHARTESRHRVAVRCAGRHGSGYEMTYGRLERETSRFANLLARLGLARADHVFVLLPDGPDVVVATLGALRYGAVVATLPAGRAAEAGRCLVAAEAAVLITEPELYERHVAPLRRHLPALRHVLVTGDEHPPAGTVRLAGAVDGMPTGFTVPPTDPRAPALVHFTAGTTGRPAAVLHAHESVLAHYVSGHYALDLHADDVLWCSVPPGRPTHTAYAIIAPLAHGAVTVVGGSRVAGFDVLRDQHVSIWYAPSAELCDLAAHGPRPPWLPHLRLVVAEGGGLDPQTVVWGRSALGRPVHDSWWQTETGAIMISNFLGLDIRPGSMGLPLPGVEAALVTRTPSGEIRGAGTTGELAFRAGWPSLFSGYLDDPLRTAEHFSGGWYLTGDLARRDAEGYLWYAGRADPGPDGG